MSADQFPSHWQLLPLSEAVDALIDYRGKTPRKTNHGVPLVTAKIVKGGTILPATEYIAEEDYDSWMVRGLPKAGDVVVTTEAPLGEVAQLANENVALAQRIVTLRGAEGLLQNDYLRYVMQGAYIQGQLESRATGSTVKGIKQSELRKIILPIPPEHEQIKIAGHLRALDDKIQLNHQINQTLEQMAQAIFKSWFVDFEPVKAKIAALEAGGSEEDALLAAMRVIAGDAQGCANAAGGTTPGAAKGDKLTRLQAEQPEQYAELRATAELFPSAMQDSELGEIPEGWSVPSFEDITVAKQGKYLAKDKMSPTISPDSNVPVWGGNGVLGYTKSCSYPAPVVLMTCRGSNCGLIRHTESEAWVSNNAFACSPRIGSVWFLLTYFNASSFDDCISGSAQPQITYSALRSKKLAIPIHEETCKRYSALIQAMFDQIIHLRNEALSLENLRDALLPKLLTGELKV